MFKRFVFTALILSLVATSADAVTIVMGKRSRRYYRHALYVQKLKNDKLTIYKKYGYPVHRFRVYAYGEITEHWKYYAKGVEFVFDAKSKLVKTERFWPENRRGRIDRFPRY
ncbi:MAG: hypothetical protein B6D63_01345 [Candidatus Latescibacteria bacterium 4484_7]|nr:MAG: hypothetical protein B6D63_01345 [Candidatus Latescibacteria bacterium 4484_7]RKZ07716.1 MAG: hypothetical protein DRQ05_02705 [bacterium]